MKSCCYSFGHRSTPVLEERAEEDESGCRASQEDQEHFVLPDGFLRQGLSGCHVAVPGHGKTQPRMMFGSSKLTKHSISIHPHVDDAIDALALG